MASSVILEILRSISANACHSSEMHMLKKLFVLRNVFQLLCQVQHLEARIMAQNAAVANTRAMLAHQRQLGPVFPAVYALLWRPTDWRRYSCPSPVRCGSTLQNEKLLELGAPRMP